LEARPKELPASGVRYVSACSRRCVLSQVPTAAHHLDRLPRSRVLQHMWRSLPNVKLAHVCRSVCQHAPSIPARRSVLTPRLGDGAGVGAGFPFLLRLLFSACIGDWRKKARLVTPSGSVCHDMGTLRVPHRALRHRRNRRVPPQSHQSALRTTRSLASSGVSCFPGVSI